MRTRNSALLIVLAVALAPWASAQCELGQLTPQDAGAGDSFGSSLSIDAEHALVGAPGKDGQGAAYLFERTNAGWVQRAKLSASDGESGDLFGASVALSGDTALVGAPGESDGGLWTGAAYVFERSGSSWIQTAKLQAPAPQAFGEFGAAVTIWFDFALVGAPGEDGAAAGSGVVHSFIGSGSWTWLQTFSDANGQAGDRFGAALALDGSTAVIGAPLDDGAARDGGSLHVFLQGAVMFFPVVELFASDALGFEQLGWSVALEGARVVGGAPFGSGVLGIKSGAAYVFDQVAGWSQAAKLFAADGMPADGLGASLALDGDQILAGAPQNLAGLAGNGRAHGFQRGDAGWVQSGTLSAADGMLFDHYGGAVGIHHSDFLVGAAFDQVGALSSGSVRVLSRAAAPTVYCTSKLTSSGCLPFVSASGSPSASAGVGFVVRAGAVEPSNVGIFFYGVSGPASVPFQGGFLCVQPPVMRTPSQIAAGLGACVGVYQIDFNAWVAGGADPQLIAGSGVHGQFWFRDPPEPISGTGLSDAIAFTLCP